MSALLLSLGLSPSASAQFTVCTSEYREAHGVTCDALRFKDAVMTAEWGDTITLSPEWHSMGSPTDWGLNLRTFKNLTIVGTGTLGEGTVLEGGAEDTGLEIVGHANVRIENLVIQNTFGSAIYGDMNLTLENVWVRDINHQAAVSVSEGSLTMVDVIIEDNGSDGLSIYDGSAALTDVTIRNNRRVGLIIENRADVSLQRVAIEDNVTEPLYVGLFPAGGLYTEGGSVTIVGSDNVFADNAGGDCFYEPGVTFDGDPTLISCPPLPCEAALSECITHGDDIIELDPATIEGHFVIDRDLTIVGSGTDDQTGTILRGGGDGRVFEIEEGHTVILRDISIQGGSGIEGGAILNSGNLTLTNVVIRANEAAQGGGAIHNAAAGILHIEESSIENNVAAASTGGGLSNLGTAALTNVSLSLNQAEGGGGAIRNGEGAELSLDGITLAGNEAGGPGTAMLLGPGGKVTILGDSFVLDPTGSPMCSYESIEFVGDPQLIGCYPYDVVCLEDSCDTYNQDPAEAIAGAGAEVIFGPGVFRLNATIDKNVTVIGQGTEEGTGTFFDGGGQGSVFNVEAGNVVELNQVVIQGGAATNGAGIFNRGDLMLRDVLIRNNTATKGASVTARPGP